MKCNELRGKLLIPSKNVKIEIFDSVDVDLLENKINGLINFKNMD